MNAGRAHAFSVTDLLSALLLAVAVRGPHDDIVLLEQTQDLARTVGWHPIWDVLLAALTQEVAVDRIRADAWPGLYPTPIGKRHLAVLLTGPSADAPVALQMPLAKLKRRMGSGRNSAPRSQAATRAESA